MVAVARDGVTYWDAMDVKAVTPVVIHPVAEPVELGTATSFVRERGLERGEASLIAYLRERADARLDNDPLFCMRVLWCLTKAGLTSGQEPDDAALATACDEAAAQERAAVEVHTLVDKAAKKT